MHVRCLQMRLYAFQILITIWTWRLLLGVSVTLDLIPSACLLRAVTPHSAVRNMAKVRVKLIHPKLLIQPPRHRDRNNMGA